MEVYIDDKLVKSRIQNDHIVNLEDAFSTLHEYGMKLNAAICSFGVGSGKFLGYLVSRCSVEASQEQIQAIMDVRSPRTIRDVQKFTGMLVALNCFIS